VRDHHRRLRSIQLAHLDFLDEQIEALSDEIAQVLTELSGAEPPAPLANSADAAHPATPLPPPTDSQGPLTFARAVSVLDMIPGVDHWGAELLVAEWGTGMARFGTAEQLAAWSGVAPGNDEGAGKRRSATTRKGNRAQRAGLAQLAHAAARTKGTYLSTLHHRLAARRGKKRAILAVAHSMVVSAFHRLSRHEPYRELGANYLDEHRRHQLVDHLARRIERLGYRVSLQPVTAA
jgi:transposase